MNQHDQMQQLRDKLLDSDGENQAVRCFLLHYQNPGVSIGALRSALRRSGFDGCWPEWVNGREKSESITKAGAQLWIRHLLDLEHVNKPPESQHVEPDTKAGNVDVMREALREALSGVLGGAYDCTRVWSAWSYGTMGPDDFIQVSEQEDRLNEILDAVLAVAQPTPQALAAQAASTERAPLIRLTYGDVRCVFASLNLYKPLKLTNIQVEVANAIMDAMLRKNGAQQ